MRLKKHLSYGLTYLGIYQHILLEVASEESVVLEFENTDLSLDLFNTTVTYRQNFCDEQERYQNGELEINLALEGRHLNVALGPNPTFFKRNLDGSINQEYPGLVPVLLDEVARRGKFTWRDSFAVHGVEISSDKTFTDILVWLVDTYDVAAGWWFPLHERESRGVSFPKGWYDGSIIIVTKQESNSYFGTFSPFSWSQPFTPSVWALLCFTMVITGLIGGQLDPMERRKGNLTLSYFLSSIHASVLVFTGHLDLNPSTHAAQLISLSLSFFAMLMLSAYTANLASFLVLEKSSIATHINTVNDIVRNQKTMCVYGQTATKTEVESIYSDAIFVEKANDKELLLGLKNDECDYGILGLSSWEEYESSLEVNGECDLVRVGRKFKEYEAGFAIKSDAGTFCTSLVRDVIHNHMNQMNDEGFIQQAWKDHHERNSETVECTDVIKTGTKEDSNVLDIVTLGGIFIFHYAFIIIAILVAITSNYVKRRGVDNGKKIEIVSQNSNIDTADVKEMIVAVNERLSSVEDQLSRIASFMQHKQLNDLQSDHI